MIRAVNIILTIASRDVIKFLRDRRRIIASLIFPLVFVGVLGNSLQSNLGANAGYNFLAFTFSGVFGQVLFQSTASGIISLVQDRQSDFAQELFIAPVSRYLIIIGKIIGETCVSFFQAFGVIIFGFILGVPLTLPQVGALFVVGFIAALLGGAFGVIVMANLEDQKAANQIFPFVIFPQFFLAGVFGPVKALPPALLIISRLMPMTYAVDLVRGGFFWGTPEYDLIVINHPLVNLGVIALMSVVFIGVGTFTFVRNYREA